MAMLLTLVASMALALALTSMAMMLASLAVQLC